MAATLVEPARVTDAGAFSTTIVDGRFQATTHCLTDSNFSVNHLTNYLGYALAVAAARETADVYIEQVSTVPQVVAAARYPVKRPAMPPHQFTGRWGMRHQSNSRIVSSARYSASYHRPSGQYYGAG